MEPVANQPIALHVLRALGMAGIEDIIVACSSEAADEVCSCMETREDRSQRVRYVNRPGPLNVAGGLSLAAPLLEGAPCLVHVGSGLVDESLAPLLERLRHGLPDVVLTVHQAPTSAKRLGAEMLRTLHLAEFDPDRSGLAMAGVWLFGAGVLSAAEEVRAGEDGDFDLTAMADRVASRGGAFHVRVADSWCSYDGDGRDLLELNRIALDALVPEPRPPDKRGNKIEGRVRIHPQANVRASVIVGPAIVGPGAEIQDAYIGPYTSVGARARIVGAEIERSIISPGASITHVGGRLVASLVGRDAKIFRDFSLPRAIRLRIGDGTELALC